MSEIEALLFQGPEPCVDPYKGMTGCMNRGAGGSEKPRLGNEAFHRPRAKRHYCLDVIPDRKVARVACVSLNFTLVSWASCRAASVQEKGLFLWRTQWLSIGH